MGEAKDEATQTKSTNKTNRLHKDKCEKMWWGVHKDMYFIPTECMRLDPHACCMHTGLRTW